MKNIKTITAYHQIDSVQKKQQKKEKEEENKH